jgi:hypothetical protein
MPNQPHNCAHINGHVPINVSQMSMNLNEHNSLCIQELNTPLFHAHIVSLHFTDYYSPATWHAVLKLAGYWWYHLNFYLTPLRFVHIITRPGKKLGGIIFRATFI